jgi:hypothetical protein
MGIFDIIEHVVLRHQGDPYHQPGAYILEGYFWEAEISAKTLAGFKLRYKLQLAVTRKDLRPFRRGRMLEPASQRSFVEAFNDEVIRPLLSDSFFWLRWIGDISFQYPTPYVFLCERRPDGELKTGAEYEVSRKAEKVGWTRNGCSVSHVFLKASRPARVMMDDELIRENYTMLTPQDLNDVAGDVQTMMAVEKAVVDALKRITTVEQAREAEVRLLAAQIASGRREPEVDPRWEKWRKDKAFLGARVKMKAELKKNRVSTIAETETSQEFKAAPPEEQQEWLKWIERQFETEETAIDDAVNYVDRRSTAERAKEEFANRRRFDATLEEAKQAAYKEIDDNPKYNSEDKKYEKGRADGLLRNLRQKWQNT